MRCSACRSRSIVICRECRKPVCRIHNTMLFREDDRSYIPLCGNCFAKVRSMWLAQTYATLERPITH